MNANSTITAEGVRSLQELLSGKGRYAIITHFNPDGDAVGSSLGLMHALRNMGHAVDVVFPNTPPHFLHWMPGYAGTISFDQRPEEAEGLVRNADAVFCLDFNRADRVGGLSEALLAARDRVLIDHHQDPDDLARWTFSDTSACSTAQMVHDIVVALGAADHIDGNAALCLYTGIMTDTGSFRFGSTTAHTHRVVASLMEKGVRAEQVHEAVMDDSSEQRLRLLGFVLSERMEVLHEQATAILAVSQQDLDDKGFRPGDTEGFVNYGLSMRGIRLAAFFSQQGDIVKISLRSKGTLPVNEFLSEHFSGGGHRNAAGGRSALGLEGTVARFKELLPAFMAAHPA